MSEVDVRTQHAVLVLFGDMDFLPLTNSKVNETCLVDSIKLSMYLRADSVAEVEILAEDIKQRCGFKGYVIPSWYETTEANKNDFAHQEKTREIIYSPSVLESFDYVEYPTDYNWDLIEDHYPNYSTSDDIGWNDTLQKYSDGEWFDGYTDEEFEMRIKSAIMNDKPELINESEWAFNKLADSNVTLYRYAIEARDLP